MSSLDKLFANSLKNDITHSFLESVEAIMFLEGISSDDFLKINPVSVYTKIVKEDSSSLSRVKNRTLSFTDNYENVKTEYDILSVWLYKLSENLRRLYSAEKTGNDTASLLEQQNNLYTISNYFMPYWDTKNEPAFFPRAVFGRHCDNFPPMDYLVYLGAHKSLSPANFDNHIKLLQKLSSKLDWNHYSLPEFFPKLALSSQNSKLLKTIFPLISQADLLSNLKHKQSSDGFKILSFEYIIENADKLNLPTYEKIELIVNFLRQDSLMSKHFDSFILDKQVFLEKISQFITPDMHKDIELVFLHKSSINPSYKNIKNYFLKDSKKTNPIALSKEILTSSFEELNESYNLSPEIISLAIENILLLSSLKMNISNKFYLLKYFKPLVEKLHPVMTKEHLATIISSNSEFLSFCKPVYLNIKLNEKLDNISSLKSNCTDSDLPGIVSIKRNKI